MGSVGSIRCFPTWLANMLYEVVICLVRCSIDFTTFLSIHRLINHNEPREPAVRVLVHGVRAALSPVES